MNILNVFILDDFQFFLDKSKFFKYLNALYLFKICIVLVCINLSVNFIFWKTDVTIIIN